VLVVGGGVVGVVLVVVVVVVVLGAVVVVVVEEVVDVEVVGVVACRQSCCASWLTVDAPWLRLLRSVGLSVEGRFPTEFTNCAAALEAAPQFPELTAEETWSSWLLRLLAWSLESRPAPPPQAATSSATANPSPPARMARDTWRIRRRTLEGGFVGVKLGPYCP
jgi:hypothetical protein